MKNFHHKTNMVKLEPLPDEIIDGKRFYTTPNGNKLPSVTTVLGHFKKEKLIEWQNKIGAEKAERVRHRASVRGTKFHNMMEKYLLNDTKQNIFEDIMPDMKQAFNDARPYIDKIDEIHYIESPLYSETLGLAGRTDVIAEYDGVASIIDFKTSLNSKKEAWIDNYFEQGTAYSLMYEELTGIKIEQIVIIISVDHEDKPQEFIKNRNDYVDSLKNKIEAYIKEHSNVY